jgi:hypothetical protein
MTKPGKNVEILNRQTDRLVEVFDAFAVPALRFTAIRLGMFRENHLGLAPRVRHNSCAADSLAKNLVEEKSYEEIEISKVDGHRSGHLGAVRCGHSSKGR